jgi:hypothetical protein
MNVLEAISALLVITTVEWPGLLDPSVDHLAGPVGVI